MKTFSDLYNDLCDLIESVNTTFTNQLILVMIIILMTDVFAIYGMMREYKSNQAAFCFLLIANSTWTIIQYSIKTLMAYCGQSTTNEAEKSLVLLTRAITNIEGDVDLKNDLNALLIQMKFRKKTFENIFFSINFNLIVAVNIF